MRKRWTVLLVLAVLGVAVPTASQLSEGPGPRALPEPLGPQPLGASGGFPNVPQTPGAVLSGLNAPDQGRTAIIAYHNGVLFTVPELPSSQPGSDFQVRTWDLSDPTAPVITSTLGISPMPINAHGYFKSGGYLVIGPNWPPEAPWSFRAEAAPGTVTRTTFAGLEGAGVRGSLFQPWFAGPTYWSYGDVGGDARLELRGSTLATWDHLGLTGVVGHPFILGDLLIFASDQSRTGIATYDISDPTNPVLLDVLTTGGPGGYWPELWGGDGKLYAVFPYRSNGNGFRVADLTDPTDMRFVTDRALPGDASMYIQFQDEYAFMGSHKVDLRTFESVLFLDGANTTRPNDGGVGIDTSQFALPLGNLLVTGGIGPDQGMAIWAHQAAPDTRGPSVGFHIPQAGRTGYPVGAPISLLIHETLETSTLVNGSTFIVRPVGGGAIGGRLTFSFDDVLTFTPDPPLSPNTTYEVVLPDGGIEDAAGNGMVGTSWTFSTGATVNGNAPPSVDSLTASAYPLAPGQNATLTAAVSDPDGGTLEVRFDFGDGSPKTAWSTTPSASHAWAAAGHYQVTAQVRDRAGSLASGTLGVTVTVAPSGPAPTASAPLLCDAGNRRVWTVNPDNDSVSAVHADALTLDLEVPACADPRSIARAATGELWVTCRGDDTLRVLHPTTGAVVDTLPLGWGSAPSGMAFDPAGRTVYVALEGRGELRRFDGASRQETGSLALGPGPRAVAVSGDGDMVLVSRFLSPKDHAEVWEVDAAGFALARTLEIAKRGGEANRDTTASGKGVPNYLVGVTLSPDGESAWVPSNKPNTERGLFFADDLDQDNTVRNLLTRLDMAEGGSVADAIDIDNSDSASAVAFSPLGDYLFATLQGNDEVLVLDALAATGNPGFGSFVTRLATGAAPQGVCVDPVTNRTFVKNFLGRSLTVLETDALFRRGDKNVASTEVSTVTAEMLPPAVLAGKRIFYNASDPRMSAEGYLSCASCHLDGGHDGRVWDFNGRGEGFRNTTTLRGRSGMAQGNVHWTANFDEIQDFEGDIRSAFGGSGLMEDGDFDATRDPLGAPKAGLSADLDALAAYVASLGRETLPKSPFRQGDGSLTAQAATGRTIFAREGCGNCHGGPTFTDSRGPAALLHDVGTLRTTSGGRLGGPLAGIDTPTLLGVWNTAPYFHDGSAPTLRDVFTVAGGTTLQAEEGGVSGGAQRVDQWVDLNNDDTVHGRAYIALNQPGARLTLSGVDGGSGGPGALEIRYSSANLVDLDISVNGTPYALPAPPTGNEPSWRHTHWQVLRLEGIQWSAGAGNTLEIAAASSFPNLSLDDVLISAADDRAAAQPHRRAGALPAAEIDALLAYLRQLDRRPEDHPAAEIFTDGFETGNTAAWSQTVP
ncbi:MAG: Ig-like domain-containing protein [Acidobacteriota bacterium]